jgi:hypothetical protein
VAFLLAIISTVILNLKLYLGEESMRFWRNSNAKIAPMLTFLKNLFLAKKPNAAMALQRLGNNASSGYWLYAAPVHLVLQRDSFSLAAPAPLPLETGEIDALTSLFNKHFGGDEKSFFWHENTWFLRLENNPNIQTSAPEAALNKDISAYLPTGDGAMQWAAFSNEIQMLLFEHPINQAREAKKLPAINSIWCYGLGKIEQVE